MTKVEFYIHVVASTPLDKSSRCKIWRNGERSFPSMRSTSFLALFNSGRRSGGHCNDLLKVLLLGGVLPDKLWKPASSHNQISFCP